MDIDHTEIDDSLAAIPDDLRAAYPRIAHQGRLAQIEAHIKGLRSLIAELPAEAVREADYEARLLALHDAGNFIRHEHPHDAHMRLQAALADRKVATA
jgi:hypothetical protein